MKASVHFYQGDGILKKINIFAAKLMLSILGAVFIALLSGCSSAIIKTTPFYSGKKVAGVTGGGGIVSRDDPKAVKVELVDGDARESTRMFLPFYYSWDNPKERKWKFFYLMPFGWNWSDGEKSTRMFLPFYYSWDNPEEEKWQFTLLIPLASAWKRDKYISGNDFFPLYYYINDTEENQWKLNFIVPFWGWKLWKEGQEYGGSFFPLLGYRRNDSGFKNILSPVFIFSNKGPTYFVFPPLFIRSRSGEEVCYNFLWPLSELKVQNNEEGLADYQGYFFPFLSFSMNKERKKFSFCWRLFSVEKSQERDKAYFFFIPVWNS
jgi:hypothetical protein